MNAIEFLTKEHNRVRKMLDDISSKNHRYEVKVKLFNILAEDLLRHEKMEHHVWYPHFKDKLPATVKHLIKDEKGAEHAIKKLEGLEDEQTFDTIFVKFKKDVEHHALEEEKNLFPEVKKILSADELSQIGQKMHEFKQAYAG